MLVQFLMCLYLRHPPGAIIFLIKSSYIAKRVYTPGWFLYAQPLPLLMIPIWYACKEFTIKDLTRRKLLVLLRNTN